MLCCVERSILVYNDNGTKQKVKSTPITATTTSPPTKKNSTLVFSNNNSLPPRKIFGPFVISCRVEAASSPFALISLKYHLQRNRRVLIQHRSTHTAGLDRASGQEQKKGRELGSPCCSGQQQHQSRPKPTKLCSFLNGTEL